MARGDVSPISERFRILVRSIGVVVATPTPTMAVVTCETADDFQRAKRRMDAAIQMLHVAAEVHVVGMVTVLEFGEPS
jgi:hypothetical protein